MPTGPFAALGKWIVHEHDGTLPRTGDATTLTIVKATKRYIKFTRKSARFDPKGERIRHGKVYRADSHTFRVSVGSFQHIEANIS